MYIFKKSLIAVVLTTASIVPAIANASSTTAVLIDSGSQTTELNYSAALPTFNAALGTLTGVTIYETAEISIGAGSSVTNNDSSPKNFTFKEALNFTFSTGKGCILANFTRSRVDAAASSTFETNLAMIALRSFGLAASIWLTSFPMWRRRRQPGLSKVTEHGPESWGNAPVRRLLCQRSPGNS